MLNSLEIKNFRSLEDFKVAKLGRVNLIVGKNNSGKSTVLEALRIYAGNTNFSALLKKIAESHDEKYSQVAELKFDDLDASKPFEDLFTGRRLPVDKTEIVIGESVDNDQSLHIWHGFNIDHEEHVTDEEGKTSILKSGRYVTELSYIDWIKKKNSDDFAAKREMLVVQRNKQIIPIYFSGGVSIYSFSEIDITSCSFIPTQLVPVDELAREWDKIVFTEHEEVIKQAMRIILPEFQNLAFVGEQSKRFCKVKLANLSRPVSLNSLGDGMFRILQLVLKIFPAKGGFLLIDEFENGLHYSVQEKVWALLFEMADKLDIQVFATTHSRDCIESFTKVALDNEKTEGVLFRMGRSAKKSNQGQIIATVFDKERLYNITQADIEIR